MTIAQIKALFQTGKIPTQADFENLISKIPNDDLTEGGDSTLRLYNPSAPHVWGYRFVTINDNYTYIFLGVYDASNGAVIPYIILRCNQGRPLEETGIVPVDYTILNGSKMNEWYNTTGNRDMHNVDDDTCINAIPSDIIWRNVGLPYGKMLSSYHIILEANEVYEKHWFDTGSPHGAIVEFAKPNLSVDKWIFIRAQQISLVNNIPEVTIRVPNGISKIDGIYNDEVQRIRESTGRPTNITPFLAFYTKQDDLNHNILNICTNANGIFCTFVFNLADINIAGNPKTLPIELMVIIDNNARFTVEGPYYLTDNVDKDSFLIDWNALTSLLSLSYGTITTTNSTVVTKCNNIKNNYMEKR